MQELAVSREGACAEETLLPRSVSRRLLCSFHPSTLCQRPSYSELMSVTARREAALQDMERPHASWKKWETVRHGEGGRRARGVSVQSVAARSIPHTWEELYRGEQKKARAALVIGEAHLAWALLSGAASPFFPSIALLGVVPLTGEVVNWALRP